jgi:predicted ATP-binding protein involved in virulence
VRECRKIRDLRLDLNGADSTDEVRHLILTGPNGSGKTALLEELAKSVAGFMVAGVNLEYVREDRPTRDLSVHFNPYRRAIMKQVSGPQDLSSKKEPGSLSVDQFASLENVQPKLGEYFVQFLVNKKAEQAFAKSEDDNDPAERIEAWFQRVLSYLQAIFGDPDLQLVFDRSRFNFHLKSCDGYEFRFDQLADGYSAALSILSELLLRRDVIQQELNDAGYEPSGIVLIDEIETHLHLELQESILPFLCDVFPNIQFIVATHSPAVICSIPDAVVYDVRQKRQIESSELAGIRYGTLMTSHLGISSDYDLQTANELAELKELQSISAKTQEETEKLESLARRLSGRSHSLALEVLLELQQSETNRIK